LGRIVENPEIKVTAYSIHGLLRKVVRGVSSKEILNVLKNPGIVFSQASGKRFLFLTKEAAVVIDDSGRIITTYGKAQFRGVINDIVKALK
jgi:hypothetical protein